MRVDKTCPGIIGAPGHHRDLLIIKYLNIDVIKAFVTVDNAKQDLTVFIFNTISYHALDFLRVLEQINLKITRAGQAMLISTNMDGLSHVFN